MNIYCPHCAKKNKYGAKKCEGCDGDLNSLGVKPAQASSQEFTPVMVVSQSPTESSSKLPTRSEWLARRKDAQQLRSKPNRAGAPTMIGGDDGDDDGDEGVSHFNPDAFSGELSFSISGDERGDGVAEKMSFQLPQSEAPAKKQTGARRGRPPGSANKKKK